MSDEVATGPTGSAHPWLEWRPWRARPASRPKAGATRARKRTLGLMAAAAAVGLVLLMLRPRPVVVDVAAVDRGPLVVTLVEQGRTHLRARTTITAPVTGHLRVESLRAGDRLEAGALVARVRPAVPPLLDAEARAELAAAVRAAAARTRQARADMEGARSAHALARQGALRLERLLAAGAVPKADEEGARGALDAASARLAAARAAEQAAVAQLAQARAMLARGAGNNNSSSRAFAGGPLVELRAPRAGTVLVVLREHEGVVAAGEPLLELADPESLEVVVPVLTEDAVALVPGTPATVNGWGGPPLDGRVQRVEPKAFTRVSALGVEEQRTQVVVTVELPPDGPTPGDAWAADVAFEQWRGEDVVRVPAGALFRTPGAEGWSTFVLDEGRARRRAVRVGHRAGDVVEVQDGLGPGALVILYPAERVEDGARVQERAAPTR